MADEVDPRFDDERVTAYGLLVEAHAAIECALHGTLEAAGLQPQWFEVLLRLGRTPGYRLRMSELAAAMTSITPSGLTRLIDRMAEAGLVERVQCESDRRGSFAVLTEEGVDRLEAVFPQHADDIERAYTSLLDPRELAEASRVLRKVRDTLHGK